ncbi:MAG: HEAT repeat domain-containing protein [Polyangiaceae bacterium]
MRTRWQSAWVASAFGFAVALLPVAPDASAQARNGAAPNRTAFLVERLHYPPRAGQTDDFRVRTTAALQLGASDDDTAVSPLCDALANDPNEVVRQSGAAALKRLGRRSALECLRARKDLESSSAVKLQISRAIEAIEATEGPGPGTSPTAVVSPDAPNFDSPKTVPTAKYYVHIARITHNLQRSQSDVENVLLGAITQKFDANGSYQLAPFRETPDQAKAALAKRKLKGFELSVSIEETAQDGNLRVRLKVAVLSYPGKAIQGELGPGASTSGSAGDKGTEDTLITMCAERAVEQFTQNFK